MTDTQARLSQRLDQVVTDLQTLDERRALLVALERALREHLHALTSSWPQQVTLSVRVTKESLWAAATTLGLKGAACRRFEQADAYTLTVKVTQDGHVTVVACDDIPLTGNKARSGQTAPSAPATAASVLKAQGGHKAGSGHEEPFVDPETGEILPPGYGMGASWAPENPNLVVEDEAMEAPRD